jgi:hypothetical protein
MNSTSLARLLRSAPAKLSKLDQLKNVDWEYFSRIPLENFWNSVALLKRSLLYPTVPMSFSRVLIGQLRNSWAPSEPKTCRIRKAEFNPKHDIIAIVHETLCGKNLLSCHWYGANSGGFSQLLKSHCKLDISWSRRGSFLLVKQQNSLKSTVTFFKVLPKQQKLIYLKNMVLSTLSGKISAQLWLSDTKFVLPGYVGRSNLATRPWVHKIQNNGESLLVCQPQKVLRNEFKHHKNIPSRGLLTALDNGYCCQVSFCKSLEARTLISHSKSFHNVVHVLDKKQKSIADIALPGLLQGLTSKDQKLYIVYRDNCNLSYNCKTPIVCEPLTTTTRAAATSRPRKIRRRMRQYYKLANKTDYGPFHPRDFVNQFECVSDGSDLSDDNCPDNNDDEKQLLKTDKECPLCSSWKPRKKKDSKLRLVVFNTETLQLETSARSLQHYRMPNPIFDQLKHSSSSALADLAGQMGTMSATDNLLFIRLYEMDRSSSSNESFQLHLSNPFHGWSKIRKSQRHYFMHPTKNVFLQLQNIGRCSFPLSLHSCPDLLTDYPSFVLDEPNLMTGPSIPLQKVDFVVTDENGDQVPLPELHGFSVARYGN